MTEGTTSDPATGNPGTSEVAEVAGGSLLTGQTLSAEAPAPEPALPKTAEGKTVTPTWHAQLPKDLQGNESLSRFDKLELAARAYLELEGKLGAAITVPGDDATDEEKAAYRTKIGVPEKPENYSFEKIELPEGYDSEEALQQYRQIAFESGLTNKQAEAFYKAQIQSLIQNEQDEIAEKKAELEASQKELRKVFGAKAEEELVITKSFLKTHADKISPALFADIEKSGLGNSVPFIQLLNLFAHASTEDTLVGMGSGNTESGGFSYPGL
jgi:hypothetical protein